MHAAALGLIIVLTAANEATSPRLTIMAGDVAASTVRIPENRIQRDDHNAYLAFEGGGWYAHSAQTGVFAGALDRTAGPGSEGDLSVPFKNVRMMSGTSGGSWFMSHVATSHIFAETLESAVGRNFWDSIGYLGSLREILTGRSLGNQTLCEVLQTDVPSCDEDGEQILQMELCEDPLGGSWDVQVLRPELEPLRVELQLDLAVDLSVSGTSVSPEESAFDGVVSGRYDPDTQAVSIEIKDAFDDGILSVCSLTVGSGTVAGEASIEGGSSYSAVGFRIADDDDGIAEDPLFSLLWFIVVCDEFMYTRFVESVVFGPLGMNQELADVDTDSFDRRPDWARDLELIWVSAFLTAPTYVSASIDESLRPIVVQQTPPPGETDVIATPANFTSGTPSSPPAPLRPDGSSAPIELAYTVPGSSARQTRALETPIDPTVPVMQAAACSGADFGNLALADSSSTELNYLLRDAAPLVSLANDRVEVIRDKVILEETAIAADQRLVRFVDGVYTDVTGVTPLVGRLAATGDLTDGFRILSLQEDATCVTWQAPNLAISLTLARLLGLPDQGLCPSTPTRPGPPQTFIPSATIPPKVTWQSDPVTVDGFSFQYRVISIAVETVVESQYGIPAGVNGTLDVFLYRYLGQNSTSCDPPSESDGPGPIAPFSLCDLAFFDALYKTTRRAVATLGGWPAIAPALGVPAGCAGDFNADQQVDGRDLADLLVGWGRVDLGDPRDLNLDAEIGAADVGALLGLWGECP